MSKKKLSFLTFIKNILRIIFSIIISLIILNFYEFNSIMKLVVFFTIYILVSLILEPVFKRFEK
jgi:hypothetical protein